jgi:Na+/proline symporter
LSAQAFRGLAVLHNFGTAGIVFFIALAATFLVALLGRLRARPESGDEDLAGRGLNRWLIGLSAGATGNSGFVVTGAVGLGYAGGVHWLLLPLSWMLGDLIYWSLFPERLNRLSREAKAVTLSELLTFDLSGRAAAFISFIVAGLLVAFLATYTSAQWLAGRKFLGGVFEFTDLTSLLFFSLTIVVYSAVGGFRGSVYADTLQAVIRIFGTVIACGAVAWFALRDAPAFHANIAAAGPDFLAVFPGGTLTTVLGFIGGYAFAAIGFGLGQPQIVTRYFAGSSPEETRSAWWIYIGFLQFTWIAMTSFGILLRGVMPNISDPETGLSLFFQNNVAAIITGIIFADVYATIASTSNSLLVAISQTFQRDLLSILTSKKPDRTSFVVIFAMGLATIGLSMIMPGNVFTIAIGSVSKIGAGVAGPVLIKALRWKHTGTSLLFAIISGIGAAYVWEALGLSTTFNEAGIGIAVSLGVNWLLALGARSRIN